MVGRYTLAIAFDSTSLGQGQVRMGLRELLLLPASSYEPVTQ